ncbi:hypothetical protein [Pseudomonas aeruginosa]|nr:hypothetical protein [Pseudomonas aeruginosa]
MSKELNKAPVEQAGGDERAAFEAWATHLPMDRQPLRPDLYMPQTQWAWEAWQFRAALAQPSQSQYEASFEEWLANELEGEDGQPVPAAVCDIALARRAFNHWPKLEHPAKVGGVRFSAGVSSRLVVEAAQRLYEFESTPEKEAERIERLQAFREQLDPLNLAPHAEAFNEAPAEALKPEQAEAERPEGTADLLAIVREAVAGAYNEWKMISEAVTEIMEAHERIVGALRADRDMWSDAACRSRSDVVAYIAERAKLLEERDAALARVAELEAKLAELESQEPVSTEHLPMHIAYARAKREVFLGSCQEDVFRFALIDLLQEFPLYAAPVAQAQHSVPEEFIGRLSEFLAQRGATGKALLRELRDMLAAAPARGQHSVPAYVSYTTRPAESLAGIALRQLKDESRWVEIRDINAHALPDMQSHSYYPAGTMIKLPAAAPGNSVPQAWLDVQAERRRQVEVEGYHGFRDSHYINYELSKAARAYIEVSWHALSGGLPCKQPESWPWRDGFKWSDGRTMLVKACALGLAEIERLDRAAERGKEVGHE